MSYSNKELIIKYGLDKKMKYLNFIRPHVSKIFNINRDKLLKEWMEEYGIPDLLKSYFEGL